MGTVRGRCFGVDLTAPTIPEISVQQKERIQRTAALAADKGRVGQINPHYVCAKIGRAIEPDDIVVNEAVTRQSIPNMQISRPRPGPKDDVRRFGGTPRCAPALRSPLPQNRGRGWRQKWLHAAPESCGGGPAW